MLLCENVTLEGFKVQIWIQSIIPLFSEFSYLLLVNIPIYIAYNESKARHFVSENRHYPTLRFST